MAKRRKAAPARRAASVNQNAGGLVRFFRVHRILLIALAAGGITYALMTIRSDMLERLLISWNAGVFVYLACALWVVANFDEGRVRDRARDVDEGMPYVLMLTVVAIGASMAAVVSLLLSGGLTPFRVTLEMVTIVLAWFFMQFIFAFHYAHEFYGEEGGKGGLEFPKDDNPDYWDFIYVSFQIGTAFQISDVNILSKRVRKFATAHSVIAFFFNVTVLALAVNSAASIAEK